jgi:hypothetical protein
VTLAAVDLLAGVITAWTTCLCGLDTLCVADRRAGAGLASDTFAITHHQEMVQGFPGSVVAKAHEPAACRLVWRDVLRQHAPRCGVPLSVRRRAGPGSAPARLSQLRHVRDVAGIGRFHRHVSELLGYRERNKGAVVHYAVRRRRGEPISTAFVESAVNEIVAKCMNKKQQMRWNRTTVQPFLEVRTAVLKRLQQPRNEPHRFAYSLIVVLHGAMPRARSYPPGVSCPSRDRSRRRQAA